jgi:signal transduction histidine kinase
MEALAKESDDAGSVARDLLEMHDSKLQRLARCLHDDIGQLLAALSMHLHLANRSNTTGWDPTPCLEITQQAIQRVRELASDLYPSILDDLALPDALRYWLDERSRRSGVAIDLVTSATWRRQPTSLEITCFRVVTEAVENAITHAAAKRICVELRQDVETVQLTIHDDGATVVTGALPKSEDQPVQEDLEAVGRRIALLGGNWKIESGAGQGSTVHACLPVDPGATLSGSRTIWEEDA